MRRGGARVEKRRDREKEGISTGCALRRSRGNAHGRGGRTARQHFLVPLEESVVFDNATLAPRRRVTSAAAAHFFRVLSHGARRCRRVRSSGYVHRLRPRRVLQNQRLSPLLGLVVAADYDIVYQPATEHQQKEKIKKGGLLENRKINF